MSIFSKIILLLFIFLLLNFISIFTFDYDEYFKDKSTHISFENKDSFNFFQKSEYKPSDFALTKIDNIIELNGTFENHNVVQDIIQALGINKEGVLNYQNNVAVDKQVLETIFHLIVPFKDFFANGSKISVVNNEILLSGELKNKMYKDLIDTIILQNNNNGKLKTEISIPQENIINNEETEQNNQEITNINNSLKLEDVQLLINNILKDKKINFERKSSIPTEESKNTLQEIAKILNENQTFKVEVAGHTDSRGEASLNKQISQDRANSVKNILISFGIDENRIKAVGYGEEFPIAKDDENGLSEINRRVEFIIGE